MLGQTVGLLVGLVLGSFGLFVALQLGVRRVRAAVRAARERRLKRLALDADLAVVADSVLHDHPLRLGRSEVARARAGAKARAEIAGRYVLTLTAVEAARTPDELASAAAEVRALRTASDALASSGAQP